MNIINTFVIIAAYTAWHNLAILSTLVAGFIIKVKLAVRTSTNFHVTKGVFYKSVHVSIQTVITGSYGPLGTQTDFVY